MTSAALRRELLHRLSPSVVQTAGFFSFFFVTCDFGSTPVPVNTPLSPLGARRLSFALSITSVLHYEAHRSEANLIDEALLPRPWQSTSAVPYIDWLMSIVWGRASDLNVGFRHINSALMRSCLLVAIPARFALCQSTTDTHGTSRLLSLNLRSLTSCFWRFRP